MCVYIYICICICICVFKLVAEGSGFRAVGFRDSRLGLSRFKANFVLLEFRKMICRRVVGLFSFEKVFRSRLCQRFL